MSKYLLPLVIALLLDQAGSADEPYHLVWQLRGHDSWIQSIAIRADGSRLVSGSDDQTLRDWDLATGKSRILHRFDSAVTAVDLSPREDRIAVGTWSGVLAIFDSATGKLLRQLPGHDEAITTVRFEGSGKYVASGSCDDTLVIWDAELGEELLSFQQGNEYDVTTLAFSPDGKRIVSGDGENQLKVWDTESGDEILLLVGHTATVTSVAWSPDGKQIVSGSWDKTLRVWSSVSGQSLAKITGHESEISSVCFTAKGHRIVSADDTGKIRVWDLATRRSVQTMHKPGHRILSLAVSQNSNWLASGSNQVIDVWHGADSEQKDKDER